MKPRCEDVSSADSVVDLGSELKEVKSLMDHPHPLPNSPAKPQPRIEIMKK